MSIPKDPVKARAGAIGAERRWGARRVVRLDQLDPNVAAAVRALIAVDKAAKNQKAGPVSETSGPATEADRGSDRHPAAA